MKEALNNMSQLLDKKSVNSDDSVDLVVLRVARFYCARIGT